jgi:hypothetical protein
MKRIIELGSGITGRRLNDCRPIKGSGKAGNPPLSPPNFWNRLDSPYPPKPKLTASS